MTLPISYLNNLNNNLFTLKTILSVSNGFSVVYTLSCDENDLKSTICVTLKIVYCMSSFIFNTNNLLLKY